MVKFILKLFQLHILISTSLFIMVSSSKTSKAETEEPQYTVLKKDGRFELRAYEPMIIAETTLTGPHDDVRNDGFWILANYIFGDNVKPEENTAEKIAMTAPVTMEAKAKDKSESQKIAMTAPVTMEQSENNSQDSWIMRFVMPSKFTLETLPKPVDDRIRIIETEPYKVLSVRFSWLFDEGDLKKYSQKLQNYADKNDIQLTGTPYSAVYDSPFTPPFLRRNEVHWRVSNDTNP